MKAILVMGKMPFLQRSQATEYIQTVVDLLSKNRVSVEVIMDEPIGKADLYIFHHYGAKRIPEVRGNILEFCTPTGITAQASLEWFETLNPDAPAKAPAEHYVFSTEQYQALKKAVQRYWISQDTTETTMGARNRPTVR